MKTFRLLSKREESILKRKLQNYIPKNLKKAWKKRKQSLRQTMCQ